MASRRTAKAPVAPEPSPAQEAPAAAPAGDLETAPTGASPAAAAPVALATDRAPDYDGGEADREREVHPFDLRKMSHSERTEKVPFRDPDFLTEAVGHPYHRTNWTAGRYASGSWCTVARYYPVKKLAIAVPRSALDIQRIPEARAICEAQGVALVAIMPMEWVSVDELRERIAAAKAKAIAMTEEKEA